MDKQTIIKNNIGKLTFDIKQRKKEYITECVNRADGSYSNFLSEEVFKDILNNFTRYITKEEISEAVKFLLNENQKVNYMDFLEKNFDQNVLFTDEYLLHLNKKFEKNDGKTDY